VPDKRATLRILAAARHVNPAIEVMARTHSAEEAEWLTQQGVGLAVTGDQHTAGEMAGYVRKRFSAWPP
jgi:CPA2 family monovalent cation:H+ antiporter-2